LVGILPIVPGYDKKKFVQAPGSPATLKGTLLDKEANSHKNMIYRQATREVDSGKHPAGKHS